MSRGARPLPGRSPGAPIVEDAEVIIPMSLRDDLVEAVVRDPRYHWQAYHFVFESLAFSKARKEQARTQMPRGTEPVGPHDHHVTGQELCEGARDLALQLYGLLAPVVLGQWGIRSTSDLGEIVYNLIAAGDLEKTPTDSRADFDDVYDFQAAFSRLDSVGWDGD